MTNGFTLDGFRLPVTVDLNEKITKDDLLQFRASQTWRDTLQKNLERQYSDEQHAFHKDPYVLEKVEIQSVDCFSGTKPAFVKLKAKLRNTQGNEFPGIAFLRGGSVAVLMILRPMDLTDERWVVMTEQPRVPAGSLSFVEIPAGMLDGDGTFAGKAAKEIMEETGFELPETELINLTELALAESTPKEKAPHDELIQERECLKNAMYPSPGGSDEFIPIFLWEKELTRQQIMNLRGKLTGQRSQGEMIRLRVCDYEELWKICARDAKTLAAWALYEGLNREGKLRAELEKRRKNRRVNVNEL